MRYKIFKTFIITSSLVAAETAPVISPGDYFPDENLTGSKPYNFEVEDPGESDSKFVITNKEEGEIHFYQVPTQNSLEREDSETGRIEYNREYNMSNPSDLDKWLGSKVESFSLRAKQISQKVQEKNGNDVNTDKGIASLKTDWIYDHSDQNSTRRKVIEKVDDVYNNLMSKISSRKQIRCYISRKLKPGYMCPMPTKENSFIIGYAQRDNKKDALAECNKRCKIDKPCVAQTMPFQLNKIVQPSQDLVASPTFETGTNVRQIIKKVEITLKITDLETLKVENELYNLRYAVSYYYEGHWHRFFENYRVKVKGEEMMLKFYMNKSAERIKIHFFRPYEVDPYKISYEMLLDPAEHDFTLENVNIQYSDSRHYFCTVKQYVFPDEDPTVACKDGKIVGEYTGGSYNQICVPNELPDYRDSELGGYKSRAMCELECHESDECIPTYRQPGVLDYNGYIPNDKYDIEIGCVDDPNNQACTEDICKRLYLDDERPVDERIWTNNDDVVITIASSVRVDGIERPKIDVPGELSSNGGNKTEVFKEEMKDAAYNSMIQRGTYNVSSLKVGEVHPSQSAYDYREAPDTGRASLDWLLKAQSDQYDDGKTYYLYPVMAVEVIYHPSKAINIDQHTIYASEDPNIRAIDRLTMLFTGAEWKIFKREEYVRMYVKDSKEDEYRWIDTPSQAVVNKVTFKDGEFMLYSGSSIAPSTNTKKFDSSEPYLRNNISLDMQYMISQIPGVLFVAQSNTAGNVVSKVYSNDPADIREDSRAYVYGYSLFGLYYKNRVSYDTINSQYKNKQFFDYFQRKSFPSTIKSETLYSDEKVKMFIHGRPEMMSVNAEFGPTSNEEGKKAFFFNFLYDEQ